MPRLSLLPAFLIAIIFSAPIARSADLVDRDYDVADLLKPTATEPFNPKLLNAPEAASPATRPTEADQPDPKKASAELIAWANTVLQQDTDMPGTASESDGKLHIHADAAAQFRIAGLIQDAVHRSNVFVSIEVKQIEIAPGNYTNLQAELRLKLDGARLPAADKQSLTLEDSEVNALIDAGKVIHAPRVKIRNGQGAQMSQTTLFPYVADLDHKNVDGKEQWVPKNANVEEGVCLNVQASANEAMDAANLNVDFQRAIFEGFEAVKMAGAPEGSAVQKPKLDQHRFHQSLTAPSDKSVLYFTGIGAGPEHNFQFIVIRATIIQPQ